MDKPYIIILTTGQSNEGRDTGGDTPVLTGVRAWNSLAYPTAAGTKWVDAEIGQKPCKPDQEEGLYWNNQFVQMCREIHRRTGKIIYWINVSHGGLSIDNWLPSAPILDMYALIQQEVEAALDNLVTAGAIPVGETLDLINFSQGESDDNWLASYTTKFDDVIARFKAESWVSADTKIMHQLIPERAASANVNIELRQMAWRQDPNFALVDTSGETLEDGDTQHWSGTSLTSIGKKAAATYLALAGYGGKIWHPTPLIRDFTPAFVSLEQTTTYSEQIGRMVVGKDYMDIEWDFTFNCANIALDNSAIQIALPIVNLTAEFIFAHINPYACTGLNLSANDVVYFQNQNSTDNLKVRMVDARGIGIAYSSGKIKTSGRFAGAARYRYGL